MMENLTFDEKNFMIGGVPTYFNCGEFHYFRVPKADWKRRMELLKAAGGNAVATYIPWLIHEPEEGVFVFDQGNGYTDLTDFLECAKAVGLYVIARPGPYSYSELRDGGLPHWLMQTYPQILSERRNGSHHGSDNVSYLHPKFLEKARAFYHAVCPILAKYTQKNGGPIALIQLDNELTGIHVWCGDRDFNRESMGFGRLNGRYPEYLKRKYGSVDAVNKAYGTDKKLFTEFYPETEPKQDGTEKVRWNEDYIEFYNATISEYLEILMSYAEENGVDCPFCHNAANPWMDVVFRDAKKRFGRKLLIGSDHYYMLCQTWEQNNPTPEFMIYCFMSAEMLRLMDNPPAIFETQYGSIADWPPTTPEDVEALLMCQLASGVRGHNGYVFTGGPNVPGTGTTCVVYDYGAPVAADGSCRPTYDALRRFGAFVEAHPEFATDSPDTDVRIMMPWRCFTGAHGTIDPQRAPELGMLANTFQKGMLTGLFAANYQPQFIDAEKNEWTEDISTPVFVPCDGIMSADVQNRFVNFIKRGGNVIVSPVIPFVNEKYEPCTILADAFGADSGEKIDHPGCIDFGSGEIGNVCSGAVFGAGKIPEGARELGFTTENRTCIGWTLPVGSGSFSWYGVATVLQRNAHIDMLKTMFEAAHGTARWRSDNTWVLTYRRRTSGGLRVILANLGTSRQTVTPSVRPDAASQWKTMPKISLAPMEIKLLCL